jgi:phage terminase small subunit
MPVLKDPRLEAFARAVALGKTHKEAAIAAGFDSKFISSKGSKVAKLAKVRQRIAELNSKIEEEVVERVAKTATVAHTERELQITHRVNRLTDLQEIRDALKQIVAERKVDPKMQNVPGGKTGYMAATLKVIRTPEGSVKVGYEYFLDDKLIKELKDTGKQVAIETGQWQSKDANEDDRPVEKITYQWVEPKLDDGEAVNGKKERESINFDGRVQ